MKKLMIIVVLLAAVGVMSARSESSKVKTAVGTVRFLSFEGGFYGIEGDDGQKYNPPRLAKEFQKDGLRVKFSYVEKTDMMSTRMWGKMVEIKDMKPIRKEPKPVTVQWIGHASFKITQGGKNVYIDPWKIKNPVSDANVILVTHSHGDHYSHDDIAKISNAETILISCGDVIAKEKQGKAMKVGDKIEIGNITIDAVPAYNVNKNFHPKDKGWLGFVVDLGGYRIYHAGDTDVIEEMAKLKDIDLAMLPIGGKYTMNAAEGAKAVEIIKPKNAIGHHWGGIVGTIEDANEFKKLSTCPVVILKLGESKIFKKELSDNGRDDTKPPASL